jgi:hypothetical protein
MKYLESFNENNSKEQITPELIAWIKDSFYDKIEIILNKYNQFENEINDIFESSWRPIFRLGIATKYRHEMLFKDESDLIINLEKDQEEIWRVVYACRGYESFLDLVNKMKDRYPLYTFESSYKIDSETAERINLNGNRYVKWFELIMSELFVNWNYRISIFNKHNKSVMIRTELRDFNKY